MIKPAILIVLGVLCSSLAMGAEGKVGPVPDELRAERQLDPFYQKYLSVKGLAILGSAKVSDYAMLEAAWIIRHMLDGRDDILHALNDGGVHVAVMAYNEYTTDVPEHRDLKPRVFWDRRARGLGGAPVSCGEENLLCFPGDPYYQENLLIHEFSHAIHGIAMKALDPTFDQRLQAAYQQAIQRGLWKGTYAGTNRSEYWAEGAQSWFDDNRENDALHNHVNTRAELKQYDPALAKLCEEVFGDHQWRYRKPMLREPSERAHLTGFDAAHAPHFHWRDEPIPDHPRVLIQTQLGDIELELDATKAPATVKKLPALCPRRLLQRRHFLPHGDEAESAGRQGEDRSDPSPCRPPPPAGVAATHHAGTNFRNRSATHRRNSLDGARRP